MGSGVAINSGEGCRHEYPTQLRLPWSQIHCGETAIRTYQRGMYTFVTIALVPIFEVEF